MGQRPPKSKDEISSNRPLNRRKSMPVTKKERKVVKKFWTIELVKEKASIWDDFEAEGKRNSKYREISSPIANRPKKNKNPGKNDRKGRDINGSRDQTANESANKAKAKGFYFESDSSDQEIGSNQDIQKNRNGSNTKRNSKSAQIADITTPPPKTIYTPQRTSKSVRFNSEEKNQVGLDTPTKKKQVDSVHKDKKKEIPEPQNTRVGDEKENENLNSVEKKRKKKAKYNRKRAKSDVLPRKAVLSEDEIEETVMEGTVELFPEGENYGGVWGKNWAYATDAGKTSIWEDFTVPEILNVEGRITRRKLKGSDEEVNYSENKPKKLSISYAQRYRFKMEKERREREKKKALSRRHSFTALTDLMMDNYNVNDFKEEKYTLSLPSPEEDFDLPSYIKMKKKADPEISNIDLYDEISGKITVPPAPKLKRSRSVEELKSLHDSDDDLPEDSQDSVIQRKEAKEYVSKISDLNFKITQTAIENEDLMQLAKKAITKLDKTVNFVKCRIDDADFDYTIDPKSTKLYSILTEYDDILTDLLLDSFFLNFQTHKMSPDFETKYAIYANPDFDDEERMFLARKLASLIRDINNGVKTVDDVAQMITDCFFDTGALLDPNDILVKATNVLKGCMRPNIPRSLEDFFEHCKKYLCMYHHRAGYEIDQTFRYETNKTEARVLATRVWEAGDEIKFISGILADLTPEEEERLNNRDFSVMFSSKRGCMCLFTGPARFVNHDCDPNCNFIPVYNGRDISFKVKKKIEIGEELTAYYGDDYFGENNRECMCMTCEKLQRGHFAPVEAQIIRILGDEDYQRPRDLRKNKYRVGSNYYEGYSGFMEKNEKVEKKKHVDVCASCKVELNNENRVLEKLDTSVMSCTHCNRCYRHELIFDIEWPKRKFVPKKIRTRTEKIIDSESPELKRDSSISPKKKRKSEWNGAEEVLGKLPPLNVSKPTLVWVDPDDPSVPLWWPAIIIPNSQRDETMPEEPENEDEITIVYLTTPLEL
ncbi:hypothetical protein HK103_004758 [Boothiomyces macroporosus]|uniref:SET domain-containing protein n=1 Tax=Boothiomyces macroporosus TaxID=261099 RepID=A0AAD5UN45_9FUNG|nr:hypothetical protein HK103_004758 [Boothiomyces macroporosus]